MEKWHEMATISYKYVGVKVKQVREIATIKYENVFVKVEKITVEGNYFIWTCRGDSGKMTADGTIWNDHAGVKVEN